MTAAAEREAAALIELHTALCETFLLSPSSSHPLVREAPDVPPVVGLCWLAARVPVIPPARAAASDLREVRR